MKQYAEHEGVFGDWEVDLPCPHCASAEHYSRLWESKDGGFEDYQHECRNCGRRWWVEGIDS